MESTKRIDNHKAEVYRTQHYCKWQVSHLRQSANKQNKRVARWYWNHPNHSMSPSHLHKIFFPQAPADQDWPLSSTKRAITDLTNDEILIQTKETCKSTRGGTEHKWRWRKPEEIEDEEKRPDYLKEYRPKEPEQMDAFGAPQVKNKGAYAEANR
ncbi:hypothetical protein [Fodinibius sp. SL11]|uniref:hypothetical protein n=1 Tax=Fodinibius sp. SL11 TaxID=3425690 RepID=UPI003F880787